MQRVAWLLFLTGCGGQATASSDGTAPEATAGSMTTPTAPANGGLAGAGGTLIVTVPDIPSPQPGVCVNPAPSCRAKDTYVEIVDDPPALLTAPLDSSCASCWVACEDCDFTCEISATARANCGFVDLRLSACAGAGPPCLDTVTDPPYYIDTGGKRWSVVSLGGQAMTRPGPATLDANLTLTLAAGTATRVLAATVHVCAMVDELAIPCK